MKLLRKMFTVLLVLATIAVGILFALQNEAPVPVDILIYSFGERSLALWLLVAFALGGTVGMLTSSGIVLRLRTSLRMTNRRLVKASAELDRLRTAGLKDGE